MNGLRRPLAMYYEHPDWFRPLFGELERRNIPVTRLDPRSHCYDRVDAEGATHAGAEAQEVTSSVLERCKNKAADAFT